MKIHAMSKVSCMNLKVDRSVNFRDEYDSPAMEEAILLVGRITEPIHARKEDGVVFRGNRRITAAQKLYNDPNTPAEVKAALEKINVIFYSDVSPEEVTDLVLDHGSAKPLTRVEILKAVWRLQKQMRNEKDIITSMYQLLADYTGNTRKKAEAQNLPTGQARTDYLAKWLHGTVGSYMLPGGSMGEFVREQFILTDLNQDRALTEDEKKRWVMTVSRERIGKLNTAKKADKESAGGWDPDKGGESFNKLLAEYVEEDKKPAADKKGKYTQKQMETTADSMQSGFRLAFLKCAGTLPDTDNARLAALDAEYYRRDKVLATLNVAADRITDPAVKLLVQRILAGTDAEVNAALLPFLPEVKETESAPEADAVPAESAN